MNSVFEVVSHEIRTACDSEECVREGCVDHIMNIDIDV